MRCGRPANANLSSGCSVGGLLRFSLRVFLLEDGGKLVGDLEAVRSGFREGFSLPVRWVSPRIWVCSVSVSSMPREDGGSSRWPLIQPAARGGPDRIDRVVLRRWVRLDGKIMIWSRSGEISLIKSVEFYGIKSWTRIGNLFLGKKFNATECERKFFELAEKNWNTDEEDDKLDKTIAQLGFSWECVSTNMNKSANSCYARHVFLSIIRKNVAREPQEVKKVVNKDIEEKRKQNSKYGYFPAKSDTRRILVPENLCSFLDEDALKVAPEDTSGCPCFPLDSSQCSHCTSKLSEVAGVEDALRTRKAQQRQNHEKLASGKGIALTPQSRYFLLPSPWLVQWRSYINMTGKNNSSVPEPELLDGVISSLKCKKHTRLLERLPEIVSRRGSLFQKNPSTDKLVIIPEDDWKCFCEEWGGIMENGVSALVEAGNNTNRSASQDVIDLDQDSSPDVNVEIDSQQLIIRTFPEVCEECIGERESCELMQKLNDSEGDVSVCLVRGKEAPKAMLEASDSFEVDRRTSKRSRRTNYGKHTSLKVSATTTVYQLKMMIWQLLGVMKENQELHKGTQVIDQESATLADMNIFPGDKLWVRDTEMHEHRDIADELCDKKGPQDIEEGFRGTLLTGDIISEAC